MNKVTISGRMVKDWNLRYTDGGTAIATGVVALDRKFKKDNQPQSDFPSIKIWGKVAEFASNYTNKGCRVEIVGRIETGLYEKDGVKHYTTDIVAEEFTPIDWANSNDNDSISNEPDYNNDNTPVDSDSIPF